MARLTLSDQLAAAQAALADKARILAECQATLLRFEQDAAAKVQVARNELLTSISELEKKLKDRENSAGYQASRLQLVESEIEQAHAVLDGVEGAPERSYKKNDDYGGTVQRNVVTRLAGAFLAIARNPGKVQA
jgi:hypothetical protein